MVIAPFNDAETLIALLDEYGDELAAIIVEPLQRIVPPTPGFLELLRAECSKRSIVLIFDEIVTGFRLAYGGAQEAYGVIPDICTLGKVIGGGFALAAIAASANIMIKTMEILKREDNYTKLTTTGRALMVMFEEALGKQGIAHQIVGEPALFDVVFCDKPVNDYRSWQQGDKTKSARFNASLRESGIFKSPGKMYPSLAITDDDLETTRAAIMKAAAELA